jgi:hypothetical protein
MCDDWLALQDYTRAQKWISRHPIGSTIVSPLLITSLFGVLVQAALPANSVYVGNSYEQVRSSKQASKHETNQEPSFD